MKTQILAAERRNGGLLATRQILPLHWMLEEERTWVVFKTADLNAFDLNLRIYFSRRMHNWYVRVLPNKKNTKHKILQPESNIEKL
jgi:hypothetical protein